jgi:hypothetical protein
MTFLGNEMPTGFESCIHTRIIILLNRLCITKLSTVLEKLTKILTNPKYRALLQCIGLSPRPLTVYEIKNKMGNVKDKYVYKMVEELIPTRESPELLVRWDKIPTNNRQYNYRVVAKLNYLFQLNLAIKDADYDYVRDNISLEKSPDDKMIIISHDAGNKVIIQIQPGQERLAKLEIISNDSKKRENSLIVKKKNNKIYLYVGLVRNFKPCKYLSASDKEDARSISNIRRQISRERHDLNKSQLADLPDVSNIRNDMTNWIIRLNIRGLLLYVLAEIELEKEMKKGDIDKKGRVHNIRIGKVLESLSKYHAEEFPFLLYYSEFKKEYDRLGQVREFHKDYLIKLIREIAKELKYQLESAPTAFIRYWVTKRYSEGITRYFTNSSRIKLGLLDQSFLNLSRDKLKNYQLRAFEMMKEYLEIEYNEMKEKFDFVFQKKKLLTYIPS